MKFQELFSHIPAIETRLGYVFSDKAELVSAFVHRSYLNENRDASCPNNERLEFLGDSVLNLIVAEYLYQNLPDIAEGKMSQLRAHAVSSTACLLYMEQLDVKSYILVGRGELLQAGLGGRSSIMSDMFEAILGAIYLDGGLEAARTFFMRHFLALLDELCKQPDQNYKALLQEHTQKQLQAVPEYRVLAEIGPDHLRSFEIGVFIENRLIGKGTGCSKKEAERNAAKAALDTLGEPL